jgi:SAM-dependent methyltransferase
LINDQKAFIESLVHIKKEDELKLKGLMPHLVYGDGEIRDGLETYFNYIWKYDSVYLDDFHENVEEKYYEINRLFLLYGLQKEIWDKQWGAKWNAKGGGRSRGSIFHELYDRANEFFPQFSPKSILDLGCGDGGGGSLSIYREHLDAKIDFVDISAIAINILKDNIEELKIKEDIDNPNAVCTVSDMLTFLIRHKQRQYSLVYANFSIIYMTKIKTIETFRRIFNAMHPNGIFMLSVWTVNYFKMPMGQHGEEGYRPMHEFTPVPMTENLQILTGGVGSDMRLGEIRRFYRDYEELLQEFREADENNDMDFENIKHLYYEDDAILRVWVQKKT